MSTLKKLSNAFAIVLLSMTSLFAQSGADHVEMADKMREDGKIWVVVAVIAVVFVGIAINMLRLDSKISKVEKELKIK